MVEAVLVVLDEVVISTFSVVVVVLKLLLNFSCEGELQVIILRVGRVFSVWSLELKMNIGMTVIKTMIPGIKQPKQAFCLLFNILLETTVLKDLKNR